MKTSITTRRKGVVIAAAAAILTLSCDDPSTAPGAGKSTNDGEFDKNSIVAALSCNADVSTRRVACGRIGENALDEAPPPDGPGDKANLIIGGQGVFVTIQTTNVNYDGGTGAFTFDATIRNLIPQPLGTADTIPPLSDPDPNGVRIFFAGGPTVTGGTGMITVVPDGLATITAPDQAYYQYNGVLDQFELSAPKTWQLNIPNTVTSFSFVLLVSAAVPRPDGYIDLQIQNNSVTPPTDKVMSWFVRNANGTLAANQTIGTWRSSDTTRATVNAAGLVNPLRAGQTIITAISQDGLKIGALQVTVRPIRRQWLGTVSTDWHTGANWSPDNVVPVATDTAVIADTAPGPNWPLLTQNAQIGGVEVFDITVGAPVPTVSLGAFDLDASGDVATTQAGEINNTVGRLILSGVARTVVGIVPRLIVSGTYSLDGNLTTRAVARVQSGRLRTTGFRIRVNNF